MDNLSRKFRLIADIISNLSEQGKTLRELIMSLTRSGEIKSTEVESLTRLAIELGFINESNKKLNITQEGKSFSRYIDVMDLEEWNNDQELPEIDRGTDLRICATIPPMWTNLITAQFKHEIIPTLKGQRLVVEDTVTKLLIITPFLDVGVLQIVLRDFCFKESELIIITSEPSLVKTYQSGRNYKLEKLKSLINSCFKSGRVLYVYDGNSIAHAKVWCSDRSLLVTSANIKADSTAANLEIGIYSDDPEIVRIIQNLIDQILTKGGISCLLEVLP